MITPMALESSITLEIGRPMTDEHDDDDDDPKPSILSSY